jgi:two-component system copper resistance phosphate regulon response regulator CusR
VLSSGKIAQHSWEESFDAGSTVMDMHVNYLRSKVYKGFDKKLIHTVARIK